MQRVDATESKFYNGNNKLPVYSVQASRFDTQEMVMILLDPDLDPDLVCKTQPVNVEHNATFIVNLSELNNPKDIYVDDMGSWNGVYLSWITIEDGFMIFQGKNQPVNTPMAHFITLLRSTSITKPAVTSRRPLPFYLVS